MTYDPMSDLDVMALTVWAESRGESIQGQTAVAWVIKNRWLHPRWWSRHRDSIPDDTIAAVCRDPWQFSAWNPHDPNRQRLEGTKLLSDLSFKAIRKICEMVLRDELPDPTGGADHYCVSKIARYTNWARGKAPVKTIGRHSFYRLEL
ncbi:MAG: cell wall hydrolase [Streptococcus sp.]|nr:cell wall hydrolase [Streptococcus sp.]